MKRISLFWLIPGCLCLSALVGFRIFASHLVVNHALGTVLSIVWGCCICAAFLVRANVSLGVRSLWRVFVVAAGSALGLLTSLVLGVGVVPISSSAELIVFIAIQAAILGFGLWRLQRRARKASLRNDAQPNTQHGRSERRHAR